MNHFILLCILVNVIGSKIIMAQDEPGAIWMPSQHHNSGRAGGVQPKYLIIHGTAGGTDAEAIGRWFQNPSSQVSAHYVVDQQGKVVQCVRERDTAWANGRIENGADPWWTSSVNPNSVTLSIEHVKSATDNSNELTEVQKQASFNLIQNILARNPGIQKVTADYNGGITGHFSVSPLSRERCPGPYPWAEMFSAIGGRFACVGIVTADVLNIRAQPNTGSAVVGTLSNRQAATLTERVNGENVGGNTVWFKTGQGYVSAYYISLRGPRPDWCF